jgi:hypothetical protein
MVILKQLNSTYTIDCILSNIEIIKNNYKLNIYMYIHVSINRNIIIIINTIYWLY